MTGWYLCVPDQRSQRELAARPFVRSGEELEEHGVNTAGPVVYGVFRVEGTRLVPVEVRDVTVVRYEVVEG